MADFNMVLPKVEVEISSHNYGHFSIGPLERGYGITLGNSLRRVLISSLPGVAVTSVRVSSVHHEFSSIPHVREDMTAFILNVKQLRFRLHNEESARLRAEIRGEGVVTAGDMQCPPSVEIMNPDQVLLTVDDSSAEFDIELVVEWGRGYSPSEDRSNLPIGEIPIDAVFSPIRKANYIVERARVGQMTDYDRLMMEITTDGSISPHDALSEAAQVLVKHFSLVAGIIREEIPVEDKDDSGIPSRMYDTPIEELDLTVRAYNCLKRAGVTQVGEILEKLQKGENEILAIRNFGQKSLDELMDRLRDKGFLSIIEEGAGEELEAEE